MGRTRWQRQRQVACGLRGVGELLEIAVFTYKRGAINPLLGRLFCISIST